MKTNAAEENNISKFLVGHINLKQIKKFRYFILPSSWFNVVGIFRLVHSLVTVNTSYITIFTHFEWFLLGINSFGFGGGNVHVILKRNPKLKTNNGKPTDELPRLVCVSARTEEGVHVLLDYIASYFDVEQIALIYNAFR